MLIKNISSEERRHNRLVAHRALSKTYRQNNKYILKVKSWLYEQSRKMETMYKYGDLCCARCGISDLMVLTLDHISNDGAAHRKQVGLHLYSWLKKNNYPPGFQVLCFNCNWRKAAEVKSTLHA